MDGMNAFYDNDHYNFQDKYFYQHMKLLSDKQSHCDRQLQKPKQQSQQRVSFQYAHVSEMKFNSGIIKSYVVFPKTMQTTSMITNT